MALAARLVEVIADREAAAARYRYGSGCIVQGRTVLTPPTWWPGQSASRYGTQTRRCTRPPWILALWGCQRSGAGPGAGGDRRPGHRPAPDCWRGSIGGPTDEPVECRAVGYPWFAETPSPAAERDTVDAHRGSPGVVEAGGRAVERAVSMAPRPLPPEDRSLAESEWSGCPAPRWWRPISCLGW